MISLSVQINFPRVWLWELPDWVISLFFVVLNEFCLQSRRFELDCAGCQINNFPFIFLFKVARSQSGSDECCLPYVCGLPDWSCLITNQTSNASVIVAVVVRASVSFSLQGFLGRRVRTSNFAVHGGFARRWRLTSAVHVLKLWLITRVWVQRRTTSCSGFIK